MRTPLHVAVDFDFSLVERIKPVILLPTAESFDYLSVRLAQCPIFWPKGLAE
jgi:hypothetical protein